MYIISNWSLENQYKEVQRDDGETWSAFLRRIHKVVIYEKDGSVIEYPSVNEYMMSHFEEIENCEDLPF